MTVKRVMRVSTWLRTICTITMIAAPLILLCGIATGQFTSHAIVDAFPDVDIVTPPGLSGIAAYVAIEAAIMALALFVLWHMRGLFEHFSLGEILTPGSADHLVRAAIGLMVLAGAGIVARSLHILLLTWNNPPGQRQLSIGLSNAECGFVLAGGLLLVVGWAMAEAARQAEENRSFV